jgi:hypothetical protein
MYIYLQKDNDRQREVEKNMNDSYLDIRESTLDWSSLWKGPETEYKGMPDGMKMKV